MSTKNTFVKKLTALVLCLCMVLPMVTTGFAPMMALLDGIAPQADAAVTEKGKVAFYVPEVIYLYPEALSSAQATATPFQYYVENSVNTSSIYTQPTPNTTLNTSGTIYFASEDGFSDVSIATRFIEEDGDTISGGSVTVGSFSNKTSYGTFSVTAGTSPSLAAATTGCYLEWTVSYTNNAGERQSAIAYTYVYKPYIYPVAAGADAGTGTDGGANWSGQITWISGIHSSTHVSSGLASDWETKWENQYTKLSDFASFISKDSVGYVNGTQYTGSQAMITSGFSVAPTSTGGSLGYAVFANSSASGYYLRVPDNSNPSYAGQSSAGTYTSPVSNYVAAKYHENSYQLQATIYQKSYGNLFIDTSRYSNLNQIPNLGIGLLAIDNEEAKSNRGTWYIADYTGKTPNGYDTWHTGDDNRNNYYADKGTVIASQGTSATDTNYNNNEGLRYVGTWPKDLTGNRTNQGEKATYRVKGFFSTFDSASSLEWMKYISSAHCVVEMQAIYYDKSTLRTSVNNAVQAMGTFGMKDNFGSYYYDTNSTAWQNFKTAYRNASLGLTKLDGAVDVSSLVTALDNAVAALKAGQGRKIYFNVNYGNINPNYYILGNVTDGGAGLTVTYNADESVTINGTISGSNAFGTTPFTPTVDTYTFSATHLSGSLSGDGCVVLDSGKEDGNNISTRSNFDFTGNAQKTITYNNTTAQETDLLRFWQWKNQQNTVYDNLTVRIKVEKGSAKTAYSPAGRIATSSGIYGTLPTPDARTGYIFGGWYKEAACTNKVNAGDAVSADMLYAKWTPITYKIVYNANGNNVTGTMSEQVLTYDKAANLTNNAFSRTGYTWLNWNTAADGSGTTYTNGQSVLNLSSVQDTVINLYAQWKAHTYTIKFNPGTGTGTMADMAMTYDQAKNLTALGFTNDGYTFTGWKGDNGKTYADGEEVKNLTATDGGVVTLTAQWLGDDQLLEIDSNGGVNGSNLLYVHKGVANDTINFNPSGVNTFSGGDSNITYSGSIDESGLDVSGTFKVYESSGKVSTETTTMLPVWVYLEQGKTYEYSYTASNEKTSIYLFRDGSSAVRASVSKHNGNAYAGVFVLGEKNAFNTGDTTWDTVADASGWYQLRMDQDHDLTVVDGVSYNYEISDFVIREVTPDAKSLYEQPTDTKIYIADPTREGYTFKEWTGSVDNLGTDKYYTFKAGENKLTATWTANTYTITYDANGGNLTADATLDYTPDQTLTIATAPTRTGYVFGGWLVTTANGNWVENGTVNPGETASGMYGDITLTAQWSKDSYTYTVEHRQQNLDGTSYDLVETETFALNTEDEYTFAVKSYTGFTSPEAVTVKVDGTGELTVVYNYTRNKYTVTTSVNNDKAFAKVSGAGEYYFGAEVTLTANVNAGYAFTNWQKDGTGDANVNPSFSFTLGAENVAWTANATAQQVNYTVIHKYENLDGTYAEETQTLSAQADSEVTPAFVNKDGFTAVGEMKSATVNGDGSTVVTYTYTRNSYDFTYELNGDGLTATVSYKYGESVKVPADPAKEGHKFIGWDGTIPETMPAEDITLRAKWEILHFTVTYKITNLNGTRVFEDKVFTYAYKDSVDSYELPEELTRGYSISSWTGEPVTMPANDVTVTATATLIEYSITYDLKGGALADGQTNPTKYTVESEAITLVNPVKDGYTFAGWTGTGLDSATETVTVAAGSTGNREYTANWNANLVDYTVNTYTMNPDGTYGEAVPATKQAKTGETVTIKPEAKTGFHVDTAKSNLSGTIPATGTLVLNVYYARNEHTLHLNAGKGVKAESVTASAKVLYGASLALTAELKDGYKDLVWKDANGTAYTAGVSAMPDSDLTLTASATPIEYTIAYDLAGGAVAGTNPTSYTVESDAITLVNPTRTGYTFAGWTGTGLDAATQTVTIAKGSTGNRSYTATWTPVTYTITYNLNGGTAENVTAYTIETETFSLNNPTKQGYAFAGWTGTGINGTSDAVEITKGSTGNREYTATWTESNANYTVKHYKQALDGSYPETLLETVVVPSTTGKTETAALKSYDGFTAPTAKTVTVLADGSATVEYHYTRNTYKIVYYTVNADDAQIEFKTIEALYEAPVTAITDVPTRTGYEFQKWDVACPATMPLDGLAITALWNPSTFTITYEDIYDDVSKYPATHTFDTETDISAVPTRDGYTFAGWTFNGNPITFENNKIGKRQFSDNFTLTATWTANATTYTVETYLMGTDGKYSDTATSSEKKDTVTDAKITAAHEAKTGFTADTASSTMTIDHAAHDGSSVLKLYYTRNQYTLTLKQGTGIASVSGAKDYYYQQSVTVDASLAAGYDWAKWTKGDADFATAKNYTFEMPAEALTLTANAEIHVYNININLANGVFADDYTAPTEYKVTDEDISIPDPTRTGYTFNGWLVNGATAPVKDYVIDTAMVADVTLVAQWTAIEYKITYVLSGGSKGSNPDTYTIESAEIKLTDPTRTGYQFIKWTEGDTIATGSIGDKTFTAEWEALGIEYNIVKHFEGFTAGNFDSFEDVKGAAAADSTVKIADIATAQTGFTFKEAKLNGGGEAVTEFKNGTTDGEVTVHLYYTRISYTLTFDTDGGTAVDAITYKYDADVAAPAATAKIGYTFAGWENLPAKMPANDVTAKAQWTINQYTITFANTGDSTIAAITADYDTAVTAPENPTKVGYTFDGWDQEIPATMPAENMTISAKWKINQYTITFDTDGGTEIAPITKDYNTQITKPADPTKVGYTFDGWDVEIPEFMPAGDMTVTAKWKINEYTISFDSDGGSAVEAITQDYNTDVTAPEEPTKTGYTFKGWSPAVPATMPAENVTLTAQWQINQYTITFDSNGGSAVNAIKQDYNSDVTAPTDPTRPGYTFKGWTPEVPAKMPADNITVTAQWEIVTYKVDYVLNGGENYADNPTEYNYEQTYTLKAPTKTGYTFTGWSPSDTIAKNSTGDKTFTATWTPNTDTPITVEYYIQPVKVNADQSEYTLHSSDATQVGTSDAEREVTPIDIEGFKTPDKQKVTVAADGTTVVKFYYTRNSYTVTFDSKGGSEVGSITALYGADITAPANPTKTGYTFKEWIPAFAQTMPVGGQRLEAVWTANEYAITYDYNVPENVTVKHEGDVHTAHTYGTATKVSDPERLGYSFAGWTVNGTVNGGTNLTLAADGYTADITLTANWTADEQNYTVVYYYEDLNGEYVEIRRTTDSKAATDSTVTLTPAATETGFTLNTEKSILTGVVPVPGTTLVLSVYYSRDTYTVTWNVEGVTTTETYKFAQTINKPANPVKTGYNFIGWNPEVPETMPAENKTFTAQFAANTDTGYKVVHLLEDLNADTYTVKETENLYGTTATTVTPEVKTYEGFTAPAKQTVTIAADGSTVVYYNYTRNSYDVTVVATDAGLSNATASAKHEYGATVSVSVDVANGYEFKGWTSDNAAVAGSSVAVYEITVPASAVTLTASAEIIKYTVAYNLDGGALADGKTNPTEFYVTTEDFTLVNPEKTGYEFLGWTGSNGTAAQKTVTVNKGTFENLTYTANWKVNQYTITYDLAGGSVAVANPTSYTVNSTDITLTNPTRAGYTFTGWTGTDLDGKVMNVTIASNSIGNRKYTATWQANEIECVVNYNWQNIYDDGYTLYESATVKVTNDTEFKPEVRTYTGFVSPATQVKKVENGVAVTIDYYYDRETHTVALTAGTGIASVSGEGTYRYGAEVTAKAVVSLGYTWKNWTADSAEASAEQEYKFTVGTADISLTANATLDTYTITYNGLEGIDTPLSNPTSYNVHSDAIVLANPEKTGYTFLGWTGTDLGSASKEVSIASGSVGNRVYTATWSINTYNLTYDLAEGSLAQGDSIPATYTVEEVITLPTPVRTGYTFKGWSDGETTAMTVKLERATGDRSYVAVWEANTDTKYTVKHYLMDLNGQYSAIAYETREFSDGISDADVTPAVNAYEGFTAPATQTVKVKPDGTTVVEYKYSRNKYKLTYYTVADQLLQTEKLYFGATIPVAPTATRDGYTFKEWNAEIPTKMPAHAVEITALWDVNPYTVSFNANGGNEMAAINYNIETAVTLPKAERTGYTFTGWTVAKTEGNWADSLADNNAALSAGLWGNVTLTANWAANSDTKYTVKHMFMNVDGTAYEEFKVEELTGTSDTTVTPAVLSGDAVIGFTAPAAKSVTIAPDGSAVVEYKYGRNQYTLTWKIKGSADETVTYYYGAAVTAKADPVLSGHTFTGWSRSIPATMPAENIEILANFDIITYTITIDYNGGKAVDNKTTYTVETDTFTLNNPTRDGYTFLGWEGTDNGENITIAKGSTGDRTYKAKWSANAQDWYVDVYYMTTDGKYNATPDESIKNNDVTDTPVSFNSADKLPDGFTFDAANSTLSGTVPGTGTLRLTAKYTRNQYTVKYVFANGTDDQSVTTYYEASLATVAEPTRTGYTFEGWMNSKGEIVTLPATMPLGGETYTAQWSTNGYTLTLDENGGTAVEDIAYNIEDTVTLPVITRDGYFFEGWKVTAENGNWLAADANYAVGTPVSGKYGSATLTAQWTTVQYTLSFDTAGGTIGEASLSYNIEEDKALAEPVRPGYTFEGWMVTDVSSVANDSGNVSWVVGNTYSAGTTVKNTYGNASFKALWSPNTYSVSVDAANVSYSGADKATVDQPYSATLTPEAGYTLPATVTVTIGGKDAIVNTDYTYTVNEDGTATFTLTPSSVIGDVAVNVVRNIITYTISYNLDNATTDPKNDTDYTVKESVTLTAPERIGYTFLGWTGSNGTTPEKDVTIPVGSTGDKNYVANWQADAKKYTVEIYYMTTDGTYNTTPDKSWTVDSFTDKAVSYDIYSTETLLTGFTANEAISTLTGTVPGEGTLTLVAKYDRNKYALTVNGCNGVTAATGTVEYFYGKEIVVDATVAMGYTWVNWQSANETVLAGSTDKKYVFNMPAANAELTAVATLDEYALTYDLAGGTLADGVTNPASYNVTTETFTLNNPTRTGYDFIGWTGTDVATPTMTVTVEKNSTTGDKHYTANWKAIEYKVTYDLADGTAQGSNYTVYTIETPAQTLTAPVKTGYTFTGWTGSNGTQADKNVTIAGGTIGDLAFTANWSADVHTYTVEYRTMTTEGVYAEVADKTETITSYTDAPVSVNVTPEDGFYIADTSVLSGTVKYDDSLVLKVYIGRRQYNVTLVDGGDGIASVNTHTTLVYFDAPVEVNAAVENGYTFEKWTSADAAVLADSVNNPYAFDMPASDVTLTATATLNRYTITYTLNDGINDAANPTTYTVLDTVNIKQPTRLGYTFTGWEGSYYGKNVVISAGTTGDISLIAKWSINTYNVSYDLAGGSLADGENNPATYTVNDSFTLYNPTRVGYDFAGWKGTGITGTQTNVTVSKNTTGDLNFTAEWTAKTDTKYTVNYWLMDIPADGNTTYTLTADSFVGEGVSDKEITPAVPVYTGFTTAGKQTMKIAADGSTVFNFYYKRNQYTYTYKAIGYEDDVRTFWYDETVSFPSDPVRNGYTFDGWNPVVAEKMPANKVVSVAQWKAISYNIGYALNGGTATGNPVSYNIETATFTLQQPTKYGYTFLGWTGSNGTTPELNVAIAVGSIGDRSYTANWEPTRYEITYNLDGGSDNGVNPLSYTIEDSITLVNPVKPGYRFLGWKGTGIAGSSSYVTFSGQTGNRTYTAQWTVANNTPYTVRHHQQDIGANTYSLFETEALTGTTLSTVIPPVKTYPGFTAPAAQSLTILPDGSATVDYYYTRNNYTIYFDSNGGTAVASQTYAFGETVVAPAVPGLLGYTFAGWTPALPETMTAGNLYVTASWTPNTDTPYTVYHYYQDTDCVSYPDSLMETEYCYGETGAVVEVATRDKEGFTSPAVRTIVIAADGSRTVRYYYTRNTYTVTFVDHNNNILDLQSVVYGLPATPPELADRAPDADGHYTFLGWSEDISFIHGYTTIKAMYSAEAHNPGADADCTKALVCTVCGYEIAPANGHIPVVQIPAVDPTCDKPGNTADSVCSVCGEVLSRYKVVPALGHDIGSWYVDVPATTTETGVLKRVCSRCDWHETHEIPVLSDTPVVDIDITTSGSQAYVGTSYQLVTTIKPANAGNKQVLWESSDPDIASVTADGMITSHKPGSVTFTVTTLDGLKTDSITINFFYSADNYNLIVVDLFACDLVMNGKVVASEGASAQVIRVKAGDTLAFTLNPTTTEYLNQGGYILTANGSNVAPDANGVYYIYNVHENIEISALPTIGKPEFDDNQHYDTDDVPEKSIFSKILEFFERIMEWFRNLFK